MADLGEIDIGVSTKIDNLGDVNKAMSMVGRLTNEFAAMENKSKKSSEGLTRYARDVNRFLKQANTVLQTHNGSMAAVAKSSAVWGTALKQNINRIHEFNRVVKAGAISLRSMGELQNLGRNLNIAPQLQGIRRLLPSLTGQVERFSEELSQVDRALQNTKGSRFYQHNLNQFNRSIRVARESLRGSQNLGTLRQYVQQARRNLEAQRLLFEQGATGFTKERIEGAKSEFKQVTDAYRAGIREVNQFDKTVQNMVSNQNDGFKQLKRNVSRVIFDIETLNKKGMIGQISAQRIINGETVEHFNRFISRDRNDPDIFEPFIQKFYPVEDNLPAQAAREGIFGNKGSSERQALEDFRNFIGSDILVGHNISGFDVPIINQALSKLDLAPITNELEDTLSDFRDHMNRGIAISREDNLFRASERLGTELLDQQSLHFAEADVEQNRRLYNALVDDTIKSIAQRRGIDEEEIRQRYSQGETLTRLLNEAHTGSSSNVGRISRDRGLATIASEGVGIASEAQVGASRELLRIINQYESAMNNLNNEFTELRDKGTLGSHQIADFQERMRQTRTSLGAHKELGTQLEFLRDKSKASSEALGELSKVINDPNVDLVKADFDELSKSLDGAIGRWDRLNRISRSIENTQPSRTVREKYDDTQQTYNAPDRDTSAFQSFAALDRDLRNALNVRDGIVDIVADKDPRLNAMVRSARSITDTLKNARAEWQATGNLSADTMRRMSEAFEFGSGVFNDFNQHIATTRKHLSDRLLGGSSADSGVLAGVTNNIKGFDELTNSMKNLRQLAGQFDRATGGGGGGGGLFGGGGGGQGGANDNNQGRPNILRVTEAYHDLRTAIRQAGIESKNNGVVTTKTWGDVNRTLQESVKRVDDYNSQLKEFRNQDPGNEKIIDSYNKGSQQVEKFINFNEKAIDTVEELRKKARVGGFTPLESNDFQLLSQFRSDLGSATDLSNSLENALERVRRTAGDVKISELSSTSPNYQSLRDTLEPVVTREASTLQNLEAQYRKLVDSVDPALKNTKEFADESKRLRTQLDSLHTAVGKAHRQTQSYDRALTNTTRRVGRLSGVFGNATHVLSRFSAGINGLRGELAIIGIAAFTIGVVQLGIAMDTMEASLIASFQTQERATQELNYLKDVANDLGVAYDGLAQPFSRLAVASQSVGFSVEETRRIFESTVVASAALGLALDDTRGIVRAIEQMISKGTVQYEELRLQLGDRLPGAMSLFAEAWHVTQGTIQQGTVLTQRHMAEFLDAMGQGAVSSMEVIPVASELMFERFGDAAEAMSIKVRAEFQRTRNAFADFSTALFELGLEDALIGIAQAIQAFLGGGAIRGTIVEIVRGLEDMAYWLTRNADLVSGLIISFGAIVTIGLGAAGFGFLTTQLGPLGLLVATLVGAFVTLGGVLQSTSDTGRESAGVFSIINQYMDELLSITLAYLAINLARRLILINSLWAEKTAKLVGVTRAMAGLAAVSRVLLGTLAIVAIAGYIGYLLLFQENLSETEQTMKELQERADELHNTRMSLTLEFNAEDFNLGLIRSEIRATQRYIENLQEQMNEAERVRISQRVPEDFPGFTTIAGLSQTRAKLPAIQGEGIINTMQRVAELVGRSSEDIIDSVRRVESEWLSGMNPEDYEGFWARISQPGARLAQAVAADLNLDTNTEAAQSFLGVIQQFAPEISRIAEETEAFRLYEGLQERAIEDLEALEATEQIADRIDQYLTMLDAAAAARDRWIEQDGSIFEGATQYTEGLLNQINGFISDLEQIINIEGIVPDKLIENINRITGTLAGDPNDALATLRNMITELSGSADDFNTFNTAINEAQVELNKARTTTEGAALAMEAYSRVVRLAAADAISDFNSELADSIRASDDYEYQLNILNRAFEKDIITANQLTAAIRNLRRETDRLKAPETTNIKDRITEHIVELSNINHEISLIRGGASDSEVAGAMAERETRQQYTPEVFDNLRQEGMSNDEIIALREFEVARAREIAERGEVLGQLTGGGSATNEYRDELRRLQEETESLTATEQERYRISLRYQETEEGQATFTEAEIERLGRLNDTLLEQQRIRENLENIVNSFEPEALTVRIDRANLPDINEIADQLVRSASDRGYDLSSVDAVIYAQEVLDEKTRDLNRSLVAAYDTIATQGLSVIQEHLQLIHDTTSASEELGDLISSHVSEALAIEAEAYQQIITIQEEYNNSNLVVADTTRRTTQMVLDAYEKTHAAGGTFFEGLNLAAHQAMNGVKTEFEVGMDVMTGFREALTSTFVDTITSADSFTEAMSNAFRTLANRLLELSIDQILTEMFFSLTNGIGGAAKGGGGAGFLSTAFDFVSGLFFHQGGVVGQTRAPVGLFPASTFSHAPRLHSGTPQMLRSDERAVIMKSGEEVLTDNDPRHKNNIKRQGSGGGESRSVVNIAAVLNPKDIVNVLNTSEGETVVVDIIQKNSSTVRQIVGGGG